MVGEHPPGTCPVYMHVKTILENTFESDHRHTKTDIQMMWTYTVCAQHSNHNHNQFYRRS